MNNISLNEINQWTVDWFIQLTIQVIFSVYFQ